MVVTLLLLLLDFHLELQQHLRDQILLLLGQSHLLLRLHLGLRRLDHLGSSQLVHLGCHRSHRHHRRRFHQVLTVEVLASESALESMESC